VVIHELAHIFDFQTHRFLGAPGPRTLLNDQPRRRIAEAPLMISGLPGTEVAAILSHSAGCVLGMRGVQILSPTGKFGVVANADIQKLLLV